MTRDQALGLVEFHIQTGAPIGPKLYRQIREIIGETTPEEEAHFRWLREGLLAVRKAEAASTGEKR